MFSAAPDRIGNPQQRDHNLPKLRADTVLARKIIKKKYFVYLVIGLVCVTNLLIRDHSNLVDWDEGVFALQSEWIASLGASGAPFNFQTPPLYQMIIALVFRLLGVHDFLMVLISTIFSCLTALVLYHLGRMLYREEIGLYAVLFFVTSEYFLFFSQSGLSDATFTFFSSAALFFFLRALRANKTSDFWKATLFTTLCLYTKYSAAPIIITFLILGILNRHTINRRWVVITTVLPLAAFAPYLFLFFYLVSPVEIGARHMPLLGLNHLKYLYYILIFAPIPFVYTLARTILHRRSVKYIGYLYIFVLVYFVILGFYYPYFRLSYPLVPILSIFAGSFVASLGRIKHYALALSLALAVLLSLHTVNYSTQTPQDVADLVRHHVTAKDIKYVYSLTPPNIYFYLDGEIAVPLTHPWHRLGKRYPCFIKGRLILEQDKNLLTTERHVLCVHATIFDSFKSRYHDIYDNAMLVSRIEYEDAPVYNKDIFNPLYGISQSYEVYLLGQKDIARYAEQIWSFGFERGVKVLHAVPRHHD